MLFGTDGIRAVAGQGPLSPESVFRLALCIAEVLGKDKIGTLKGVLARDTRLSGEMIASSFTAALLSRGVSIDDLGVMPTPALSVAVPMLHADFGVMISASHNPFRDNGIKLFTNEGLKLSEEVQNQIEELYYSDQEFPCVDPEKISTVRSVDFLPMYQEYLKKPLKSDKPLSSLRIVVDCANGVQSFIAPTFLASLGAEVIAFNTAPDGVNINLNCGAVYPESLCRQVVEHKADIGLCFDGDADRLIVSDEKGGVVDGDFLIAVLSDLCADQNPENKVVTTVMSNLGLEKYFEEKGVGYQRSTVGDRFVMGKMQEIGAKIGGEASGHLILSAYAPTGDGLLAAVVLCQGLVEFMAKNPDKKAGDFFRVFKPYPQKLENFRFESREVVKNILLSDKIQHAEQISATRLAAKGRLLLRASGTEPLLRVMIEAEDPDLLEREMDFWREELRPFSVG